MRRMAGLSCLWVGCLLLGFSPGLAGINDWTPVEVRGGAVFDFAFDSNGDGRVFVAGPGVLVRDRDESEWTPTSMTFPACCVVVHPADSSVIYAGTLSSGVYRSSDSGATWIDRNEGLTNLKITALQADPISPDSLFVGTRGGIFGSTNGGTSWTHLSSALPSQAVEHLVISQMDADTLYAIVAGIAYRTADAGLTWSEMSGLPVSGFPDSGVLALAFDPSAPASGYAVFMLSPVSGTHLYKTVDAGLNWSVFDSAPGEATDLAVDPVDGDHLWLTRINDGLWESVDGGLSWARAAAEQLDRTLQVVVVDEDVPGALWVGGRAGGVYRREAPLKPFSLDNIGFPQLAAVDMALGSDGSKSLTVLTKSILGDGQFYRSANDLTSWEGMGGSPFRNITIFEEHFVRLLEADPADPLRLYAALLEGVVQSSDGGRSWSSVEEDLTRFDSLAVAPWESGTPFATTFFNGLLRRLFPGFWSRWPLSDPTTEDISFGLPETAYVTVSNSAPALGGIYESVDGGDSWDFLPVWDGAEILEVSANPHVPGLIFALGDTSGLVRTVDGGGTWTQVPGTMGVPEFSALVPQGAWAIAGNQLVESLDQGVTWELLGSPIAGPGLEKTLVTQEGSLEFYALSEGQVYHLSRTSLTAIFLDGFESGDTSVWSFQLP
ncbi:MAG: hypothetical protein K0U98_05645 [Deltaproteobacteria bacterium]|nr:hypothetical protein [Deltaproteobacteria bacterium]